ncbi:MAG TPA: YbaB/EbfC family nucleoid-associated protein [Gemmataceae bacterium]|nr:YbaB/EbfC family nucleoid-associated protein [Gemmataceae bacterium]
MFEELRQFAGLMRSLPKIKEEAEKFQAKLREIQAEGSAGGDMVKVRINGQMEVQSIAIAESAWALQDREMLEDLIRAAVNQAIEKVREKAGQEAQSMAASLGIPPGLAIPGLE